jgi:leader peptidase (prepilin peptidase) / N-methyltransferase
VTPFGLPPWIVLTLLFVAGACLARWINVCAERIPQRLRMADQFRVCTDRIARQDLLRAGLPIVGPLTAAGRRVFGSRSRAVRAAFVELLNGGLLAALYWCEVPFDPAAEAAASSVAVPPEYAVHAFPGAGWSPVALLNLRYLFHAILVQSLLAATLVDMEWKIIPAITTDPFTVFGVVVSFVVGGLQLLPVWFQEPMLVRAFLGPESPFAAWPRVPDWIAAHPHWHGLAASLAGVAVGGGVVWIVRVVGHWTLGREAMGAGDVYLMMTVGAFLGWQAALVVFFAAPLAALAVYAVRWIVVSDGEIPYGPYLSFAAVVLLFGWREGFPRFEQIFLLGPILLILAVCMTGLLVAMLLFLRGVKRLLGLDRDWSDERWEVWSAADQHQYQAGEEPDDQRGRWRTRGWPGVAAGSGRAHYNRWRHGERRRRR